jgi:hypothetical protein
MQRRRSYDWVGSTAVGNLHYLALLWVCLGKMMSEARSDELVTLTRSRQEALAIDDGHLLAAALDQPCIFQLTSSVRDRRPLYAEHFGEQILRDQQCVIVVALSHHQQPARQSLFQIVRTVARH